MGHKSKLEYLLSIVGRYRRAGRQFKTRILDEFCKICGHHRKHAIRLLSMKNKGRKRKPGRPSRYGEEEVVVLETRILQEHGISGTRRIQEPRNGH